MVEQGEMKHIDQFFRNEFKMFLNMNLAQASMNLKKMSAANKCITEA